MKLHPIKHYDGKPDKRYTVRPEYTGSPRLQYVARFCGDWVGSADTYTAATQAAKTHRIGFCNAAGIPVPEGVAA